MNENPSRNDNCSRVISVETRVKRDGFKWVKPTGKVMNLQSRHFNSSGNYTIKLMVNNKLNIGQSMWLSMAG